MGILDSLMGGMLGGSVSPGAPGETSASPLIAMALQLVQQNGGLAGIVTKFQKAGYGSQADSWVSTGQNQPISGDALSQVLGQGQLGQIAQQLGMSHGDAAGGLASLLPQLIDRMTPQGQIPGNHQDIVAQALSLLQQRTG